MKRILGIALAAIIFVLPATMGQTAPGTYNGNFVGTFTGDASGATHLPITQLTPLSGNVVVCTTSGGILTGSCATAVLTAGSGSIGGTLTIGGVLIVTGNVSSAAGVVSTGPAVVNAQGAWLMWNRASGSTYLVNQKGGGSGGISLGHSDTANNYTQDAFLSETGTFSAALFSGSGASLNNIPWGALPYQPVQTVAATSPVSSSGGTNPTISCTTCVTSVTADESTAHSTGGTTPQISLKHGDYVDLSSAQTIGGTKTLSSRPVMSGMALDNFGATSGRSGTATLTLPNDGKTYNGWVEWAASCVGDTPDVTAISATGTSNFNHLNGAGYNSGTLVARAFFNATGQGQTLSATLSSGGGTSTSSGLWHMQAVAQ